jgi:hypothetical protein
MSFLAFTKGKKISAKIAARQRCGAENPVLRALL